MRDSIEHLSIADCASEVTALYGIVDAAESEEWAARRKEKEAHRKVTALVDYLAVVVPETTTDTYLIAALLDSEMEHQMTEEQHERVHGIVKNLNAGLRRIVEADPSTRDYRLPPWLQSPTRRPFGGEDDEPPPA